MLVLGYGELTEPILDEFIETEIPVVATNDDEDALSMLTVRQLRPDVRIVAAATERENAHKLRRASADTVIGPAVLGGHMLVQSALDREDVEAVADRILGGEG